jgi:class 3 adenylate cyclase
MSWRLRRRGFFETPPRILYRRSGPRYFVACAWVVVLNGVVVAAFGVIALLLFVDVSTGEVAVFAGALAVGFAFEGVLAAVYLVRTAEPARSWLAARPGDGGALQAWSAITPLPVMLVRRPALYVVGGIAAAVASASLTAELNLPAYQAAWLFAMCFLLYLCCGVLRYVGLELSLRPVLRDVGETLPEAPFPDSALVSLHERLLATVPMVTWGAALLVAGLVTPNRRDFDTLGLATLVALGVTAAISIWLSLVLADAVSGPIVDLRDAADRVGSGDLAAHAPVVSTDETGELAAAFNSMVAGLRERERLHAAFGTFVDPALTERVLAEGPDLRGEEIDATILFLDVRGFTEFAERAAPHDVVAGLNQLYAAIVPVVERHGGHANKFIGDGLLAVFGAPERHRDHALRGLAAAREIAQLVRGGSAGVLRVGLGLNTGRVVVGTIGGGNRRDFTVIGDPVNTAARVEAATRLTGDDILITENTLRAVGDAADDFEERPSVPLKGKTTVVRLYGPRSAGARGDRRDRVG